MFDPDPRGVRQLVEKIGGKDRLASPRCREARDVRLARVSADAQLLIGPLCFVHHPRMAIEADNRWRGLGGERPRRAGGARAAPEIDDRLRCVWAGAPGAEGLGNGDEMQRGLEQCERRTLARAVQRPEHVRPGTARRRGPASALDVRR